MIAGKTIFLSFPQWQGAGAKEAMGESSAALPQLFPEKPWLRLPVEPDSCANIDCGIHGRAALLRQLDRALEALGPEDSSRIFVLGGDCSVELAPVALLAKRYGTDFGVVWLDAHPDLSTPSSSLTHNLHGMVLLTLFGDGDADFVSRLPARLTPDQVVLAGVRETDPHEDVLLDRLGLRPVSCEALNRDPAALSDAVEALERSKIFVHLDLDVLEPSEFSSIAFPTPTGVRPTALAKALEALADRFEIVGFGITEYVRRKPEDERVVHQLATTLMRAEASG